MNYDGIRGRTRCSPNFLTYFNITFGAVPGFPNRNHVSTPTAFLLLSPSTCDNIYLCRLSIR
jgi:hypothetical protein